MKRIIKGDMNLSHLVIAHTAIDRHQQSYGDRRQGWPSTYLIRYKNNRVAVEVVTRRQSYVATLMIGARNLSRLCNIPSLYP
ncbi:hypothetical protein PL78_18540 [Yersinia entomophaga]|uniref:DUF4060 domain-containing protein n=1 Tax=Yersinia entomophaga TaxID=935293 RepID=A0ABN4PXX8_YERET|nr:DUF4060 family protein [Yersinia entomophaga]ANI31809.1 hypothetical protein PL78_18540 [Yersinia entomophaga]OWF85960.1 hypothetical protein B4914_15960 [Yersinia entomophaga]